MYAVHTAKERNGGVAQLSRKLSPSAGGCMTRPPTNCITMEPKASMDRSPRKVSAMPSWIADGGGEKTQDGKLVRLLGAPRARAVVSL